MSRVSSGNVSMVWNMTLIWSGVNGVRVLDDPPFFLLVKFSVRSNVGAWAIHRCALHQWNHTRSSINLDCAVLRVQWLFDSKYFRICEESRLASTVIS